MKPTIPEDEPFLFQVFAGTRERELGCLPLNEKEKNAFLRMQYFAQKKHYETFYDGCVYLLIQKDDVPVGRLYIYPEDSHDLIVDIALLPEYRNRGIGTRLIKHLIEDASRSQKVLLAHVDKTNPAMVLYERVGFIPVEDLGICLRMEHPCQDPPCLPRL